MSQKKDHQPPLPLHRQIAQSIQQDIVQQGLPPHTRILSEAALTQQYKVSHNTINKALETLVHQGVLYRLRPQGTFVAAPSEKDAVLAMSRDASESSHIGFIVPYLADSFLDDIVLSVATEARTAGYRLDFVFSENDWAMERYHINQFLQQKVAGIVIFSSDHPVELRDGHVVSTHGKERVEMLRTLQEQQMPFVLLDRYIPEVDCNYVVSDDIAAGYEATRHLIAHGHQRIGFISISPQMTSSLNRMIGYRRALTEYGIDGDESLILQTLHQSQPSGLPGHFSARSLDPNDLAHVCRYLQREDRPTAVLAMNDYVALQVLQAAQDVELNIPDDLALVCCGGGDIGALTRVPLTSILQPAAELGRHGMHILLNLITQRTSKLRQVTLPVSLIVRKSCGADQRNVALALHSTYADEEMLKKRSSL